MYAEPPEWDFIISQNPSPVICAGDNVYLQANTAEDLGPLEYVWSTGGDVQTELVNLDTTTTVVLTVTDACGTENIDSLYIEIPVYDPITVYEDDVCVGLQARLDLEGGSGIYTFFTWQYSNFDSEPESSRFQFGCLSTNPWTASSHSSARLAITNQRQNQALWRFGQSTSAIAGYRS